MIVTFALAPLLFVSPPAASAVIPGQIDRVDLASSARNQGVGGALTLTATVFIGSDRYVTKSVHDLNLTLSFTNGLQVVDGENPRLVADQPAQPGLDFAAATFVWTLNSTRVGDYRIDLVVTSADGGGATASVNLTVRVGPVVGRVTLQPTTPTTKAALSFAVPAKSGFEDPDVLLNVTLYIFQTSEPIKVVSANRGALRLANADRSWTFVAGTPLAMDERGGGNYVYDFPSETPVARGALVYWVYAEVRLTDGTTLGNATTAPVRVFVEDPGVTAAVFWGAISTTTALAAAALYAVLYDPWGRKPATGAAHNSPDRIRLGLLMLVVGSAILATAFASGAADGLWRWFGYL